jgi:hypothetical protein
LTPLNSKTVAVKLQVFKILGFVSITKTLAVIRETGSTDSYIHHMLLLLIISVCCVQIPVKAPDGTARGELEITYVDEELRISRGKGNLLFILKMFDPTYRIPL